MPYVEWKSWQEAVEELQKAGLGDPELEYEYDDNVPKGDIVSQNIEEGTELEAGDVVRLTVSRGQREKRSPG